MWSKIGSYVPEMHVWLEAIAVVACPLLIVLISRWLRDSINRGSFSRKRPDASVSQADAQEHDSGDAQFGAEYAANLAAIREAIGMNGDVIFREFLLKGANASAAVIYIEGGVDHQILEASLIRPLMHDGVSQGDMASLRLARQPAAFMAYIGRSLLTAGELYAVTDQREAATGVLTGKAVLLVDGMEGALLIQAAKGENRSMAEPLSEALLRGPRIGFTEKLRENTAILRMYGSNESLLIKKHVVGQRIKKELAIAYMKDIANPELVQEVNRRVATIDMDALLESGYVEQLIEDDELSPFQQMHNTERPDRVMSALLEGRVAILLDGTPFALIAPATFSMLLQSPEDYYERWIPGSFLRMLRFMAAMLALFAPALYISFISFHPGLIPTKLVMTIIVTRKEVPFPSILEVLIMEIAIEILREAGIRLPKPIGPAMGIVGGLIIGDAAVQAGIISPFLVIVVAVTAISSFSIPTYSAGITLRMLRFAAMMSAAIFGLYGVIIFFLLICTHLSRLTSFGVPYVAPVVPYSIQGWKDFLIRVPLNMMRWRAPMMKTQDQDRRQSNPNRRE